MSSSNPQDIIPIGKQLHQKNMLASCDGNISVRVGDEITITPSMRPKRLLSDDELARMSITGDILSGTPSTERLMHLLIYQHRKDAKAIIHAHPTHAIALSIARPHWQQLPTEALPEIILALGYIPIIPYATPGTKALSDGLLPHLSKTNTIILGHHGAVSWGDNLEEAMNGMERIEHVAQIITLAEQLGGAIPLPPAELERLRAKREEIGTVVL